MDKLNWEELDKRPIPTWFQDAKFGVFIHWGVYSVPAYRGTNDEIFGSYAEWYYASVYGKYKNHDMGYHKEKYGNMEYRDFAKDFKCEKFDPDSWANLFKKAGAQYVVLTTKHHDGYCLWDTKIKDKNMWKSTDIGPKKDLLKDLSIAVRKKDIKMGIYYSIIEWETNRSHRVDGGYFIPDDDAEKYGVEESSYPEKILLPQLTELVENYKPSLIFSDGGEWDCSEDYVKVREFLTWLYKKSPVKDEVVVNDRFYKGMEGLHGDYYSTEYNDKVINSNHPWEESRGLGKSYGYNQAETLSDYLTTDKLIVLFVDILTKGGNLLLNVGPTKEGIIPLNQEQVLLQFGEWFETNKEGILGTRVNDSLKKTMTKNGMDYVYIKNISDFNDLLFDKEIESIKLLGYDKVINFEQKNGKITINSSISAFDFSHKEYSVFKINYL